MNRIMRLRGGNEAGNEYTTDYQLLRKGLCSMETVAKYCYF
jgi:hypothetical protein